ncbi:hypothetical protein SASPL_158111 [Salvia splendens]|uniref:Xyloglucan:xyloglucosyl transferase n=1 Tax=Salvia splendens TaxID=180675 RepID=A0A8X8VTU0_SALSN|nr:uncharacterized protein LOC121788978 [Salvia splendens]KAG6382255.1 hypothetical protein SASPL_158111 [Salvia splendens]
MNTYLVDSICRWSSSLETPLEYFLLVVSRSRTRSMKSTSNFWGIQPPTFLPAEKAIRNSNSASGSIRLHLSTPIPTHHIYGGTTFRSECDEAIGTPFPKTQAMRVYCSLWNADDWGRVKADWSDFNINSAVGDSANNAGRRRTLTPKAETGS